MTKEFKITNSVIVLIIILAIFVLGNQILYMSVRGSANHMGGFGASVRAVELSSVDINSIETTAQGIALLFPLNEIKTSDDAVRIMVPTGVPSYGDAMGVSFDDPLKSLEKMANAHPALLEEIKEDNAMFQRYLNLVAQPRGISCEYCCGLGATGASKDGKSMCGCQHNPALLSLTSWLIMNTDMSDVEILQEAYRWKTLFFPKDMVSLATQIAGGDESVLKSLPGMVGGC